jgi:hypothetical protein
MPSTLALYYLVCATAPTKKSRTEKNPPRDLSCSRKQKHWWRRLLMVREEAGQGGCSEDGGSGGGSSLGAGGSGGGSASSHLWHGGLALGSFSAFMAAAAGVPGGGMGPWGSVPGGPGAFLLREKYDYFVNIMFFLLKVMSEFIYP